MNCNTKNKEKRNKGIITSSIINHLKIQSKKQWIQKYALRIYKSWLRWQGPLGIASDYIEQVKRDLEEIYPDPLKRVLIEGSY